MEPHTPSSYRSSPPFHIRRTPTAPGQVAGANGALPLPHRHSAELCAAAAGGAQGHRPDPAQLGSQQFAAVLLLCVRERARADVGCLWAMRPAPRGCSVPLLSPVCPHSLSLSHSLPFTLCLPRAHPSSFLSLPGLRPQRQRRMWKTGGAGLLFTHRTPITHPFGGFLYHFLVSYNRFRRALAELKGGRQSPRMGNREV